MSQGGSSSRLPRVIWTGKQTDDWYDDVRGGCNCFWRHRVKCTWKQTDDRDDDDVRGGQAAADCPEWCTQGNRLMTGVMMSEGGKLLLTVQSEAHRETGNRLMTEMVTPERSCCRWQYEAKHQSKEKAYTDLWDLQVAAVASLCVTEAEAAHTLVDATSFKVETRWLANPNLT